MERTLAGIPFFSYVRPSRSGVRNPGAERRAREAAAAAEVERYQAAQKSKLKQIEDMFSNRD
jgi:hypothetical protein